MIPNIIVPMPMNGGMPLKAWIAFAITIAMVSVLLIVAGIIYDGIKHKIWTLHPEPNVFDRCGYMNLAKMAGYLTLGSEIIVTMLVWLAITIFYVI